MRRSTLLVGGFLVAMAPELLQVSAHPLPGVGGYSGWKPTFMQSKSGTALSGKYDEHAFNAHIDSRKEAWDAQRKKYGGSETTWSDGKIEHDPNGKWAKKTLTSTYTNGGKTVTTQHVFHVTPGKNHAHLLEEHNEKVGSGWHPWTKAESKGSYSTGKGEDFHTTHRRRQ